MGAGIGVFAFGSWEATSCECFADDACDAAGHSIWLGWFAFFFPVVDGGLDGEDSDEGFSFLFAAFGIEQVVEVFEGELDGLDVVIGAFGPGVIGLFGEVLGEDIGPDEYGEVAVVALS